MISTNLGKYAGYGSSIVYTRTEGLIGTEGALAIKDGKEESVDYIKGELKKRDERIDELELKLSALTKQVASIIDGSKDVIDDNVTVEQLRKMFDDN